MTKGDATADPQPRWFGERLARPDRLAAVIGLALVLALAAFAGVSSTVPHAELWRRLMHPHWDWLLAALAAETVAFLGYTLAYREVARAGGGIELGLRRAFALVVTGFGVFLHGGGFALDQAALHRAGLPPDEARARVLALGALEYATLALAAVVAAALAVAGDASTGPALTLPWLVGVPLGTALAAALFLRCRRVGRHGWRRHLCDCCRGLELVVLLTRRPRSAAAAWCGICLYWAADIACLWAAVRAFVDVAPPTIELLIGYATGYALTRRTLPLGGAGVVEALLPLSLGWAGVARLPAILGVAAYRVLNLWLPMLPALAGLPVLRRLQAPGPARDAVPEAQRAVAVAAPRVPV